MGKSNKALFSRIIDDVMKSDYGAGNDDAIKRRINSILRDHDLADSYECVVRIDKTHPWQNKIMVGIAPRSVIDQLAAVGNRGRAQAAYERGIRDGDRLVGGEISIDELVEEFNADPP